MKRLLINVFSILGIVSFFFLSSCKKKEIDNTVTSSEYLTVEKKNMSFIQKYSGTWCEPCGGWGFTQFSSLYSQFGSTEAFGAVVSGGMGVANNEEVFTATQQMYGSSLTGTPNFMCNFSVVQATQSLILNHRNSTVIANSNYELTVNQNDLSIKTTTQFFQSTEGKEYYLFPYVIVDGIKANQSGHDDGANTIHKMTIVDVAKPMNLELASYSGYKVAEGKIAEGYKFNLAFKAPRNSAWASDKISIVLVIAYKEANGKFKFVNSYTKH
jgi:hypothetical protein